MPARGRNREAGAEARDADGGEPFEGPAQDDELLEDWYPEDRPYDRNKFHDRMRAWLAAATLGVLAVILLGALFVASVFPNRWNTVSDALEKVLPPISGFAGLALAYFFGQGRR